MQFLYTIIYYFTRLSDYLKPADNPEFYQAAGGTTTNVYRIATQKYIMLTKHPPFLIKNFQKNVITGSQMAFFTRKLGFSSSFWSAKYNKSPSHKF